MTRCRLRLVMFTLALSSPVAMAADPGHEALLRLLPRIDPPSQAVIVGKEIAHLFVLVAVDTDDQGGITWGRDGANVKELLEAGFRRQNLQGRFTIDVFTGKQVTPDKILSYFRDLASGPDDGVVFYYSGHGGRHLAKGHFFALTHGKLFRQDLLQAMNSRHPRLRIVLSDCCANNSGGAFTGEPKVRGEFVRAREPLASRPPAVRDEPKVHESKKVVAKLSRPGQPPRPLNTINVGKLARARQQEPKSFTFPFKVNQPRNSTVARREEPPVAPMGARTKFPAPGSLPTLLTHEGSVSMKDVIDANDGAILRDLFYKHSGLVDINGSESGEPSFGHIAWGGSLFTNALIVLQKSRPASFDTNANRVVEWSEFFPHLRKATDGAGSRVPRERIRQSPEAKTLGELMTP